MSCDKVRSHLLVQKSLTRSKGKKTGCGSKDAPKFNTAYLQGPGRALKHIFVTRFKVGACDRCHETAKEMDEAGPDEVLAKLDYFANQLHENAQKRKWLKVLDFVEHKVFHLKHYKSLIRESVNLHNLEVSKRDAYLNDSPEQGA